MNNIQSLKSMCLTILADTKFHNPEIMIPCDNIPSELINEIFIRLAKSDNKITIKMPPDGETIDVCISHDASITEFLNKVARAVDAPFSVIRLFSKGGRGKSRVIGGGHSDRTLCEWFGIKIGESATATLLYFSHTPGSNYPQWPKQL